MNCNSAVHSNKIGKKSAVVKLDVHDFKYRWSPITRARDAAMMMWRGEKWQTKPKHAKSVWMDFNLRGSPFLRSHMSISNTNPYLYIRIFTFRDANTNLSLLTMLCVLLNLLLLPPSVNGISVGSISGGGGGWVPPKVKQFRSPGRAGAAAAGGIWPE